MPGCPFDGGEGQRGVVAVQAGQCVLQIDGYGVGQTRREAQDAALTAGTRQVCVVQGGDGGGPVDQRHRGAVDEAGCPVHEGTDEVDSMQP